MAAGEDSQHYVELCKNPIRFEPVSKANNVFFDDANKQVQHVTRQKQCIDIIINIINYIIFYDIIYIYL